MNLIDLKVCINKDKYTDLIDISNNMNLSSYALIRKLIDTFIDEYKKDIKND